MNKICILRSNPIDPDSRVEKEATTLIKNGYDVVVFAWDRNLNYKIRNETKISYGIEIPIYKVGYKAVYGGGIKNIIPLIRFEFAIVKFLIENKFNIVHACDFDTAFFSILICKIKKTRFIFDIFDFKYSDASNIIQLLIKKIQYMIINHSDAVIICTEERKKQINKCKQKNIYVIHNSPPKQKISKKRINKNKKKKACYVGVFQKNRLLLEIGKYFENHKEVELHIAGFGLYEDYFQELSKKNDNIFYYGKIQYDETLKLENNSDFIFATYNPNINNHRLAAPNKFYESLLLKKPVIMCKNTGMSKILEENKIGVLIDYSYNGICSGIENIIEDINNNVFDKKVYDMLFDAYCWDKMEFRLLELYKKMNEKEN